MRGRPPKRALTPEQERAARAFVGGAEAPDSGSGRRETASGEAPAATPARKTAKATRNPTPKARPWEAEHVREDVVKGYALRLPEPLFLQTKWVAKSRGQSMNELCREAIESVVRAHLSGDTREGA